MPKRTNEFQRLVKIVKEHAAEGATVTESKMLPEAATGIEREVDICIESTVAGHDVTVSIECLGEKRRASITWVEQQKSKHDKLKTDRLVLVSRSGFTKGATENARLYGIETLQLDELDDETAENLFGEGGTLWSKAVTLVPRYIRIGLLADNEFPAEEIDALPNNLIYTEDGMNCGNIKSLIFAIQASDYVTNYLLRSTKQEHRTFEWQLDPVSYNEGRPLFLMKEESQRLRQITRMVVTSQCTVQIVKVDMEQGRLGNTRVAWGYGDFMGSNSFIVASETPAGDTRMSVTPPDGIEFDFNLKTVDE